MKEALSKLGNEWIAIHYQLKHLPHLKMLGLGEAVYLDKSFLKLINRVHTVSLPLKLVHVSDINHPKHKVALIS